MFSPLEVERGPKAIIVGQGFGARLCLYKTDVSLAFLVLVKPKHAVAAACFAGVRPQGTRNACPAISAVPGCGFCPEGPFRLDL